MGIHVGTSGYSYPEWRGSQVVLISGRYVIVRPQTREIVYIIES